jgi:hypothetical protein
VDGSVINSSLRSANSGSSDSRKLSAQIDQGIFVHSLVQSECGQVYKQTLASYNGMIVALGAQGLHRYIHLRWDESLQIYKRLVKGSWIQEFTRAIDIYSGKVKGFRDVPED